MTHPFRTSILIYEQSKICHFWQCDWLIFVYVREKLAELTNQSKMLLEVKKLLYLTFVFKFLTQALTSRS